MPKVSAKADMAPTAHFAVLTKGVGQLLFICVSK